MIPAAEINMRNTNIDLRESPSRERRRPNGPHTMCDSILQNADVHVLTLPSTPPHGWFDGSAAGNRRILAEMRIMCKRPDDHAMPISLSSCPESRSMYT